LQSKRSAYLAEKRKNENIDSRLPDNMKPQPLTKEQQEKYDFNKHPKNYLTLFADRTPINTKQHITAIKKEADAIYNYNPNRVMKSLEVINQGIKNKKITDDNPDYLLLKRLSDNYEDIKKLNKTNWTDTEEANKIKNIFKWYEKEGAQENLNY